MSPLSSLSFKAKPASEQPVRPSATGEADLGVSLEVTLQQVNFWAYPEGQRPVVRCACLSSWMTQPSLTTRTCSDLGCSGWSQAGLVSAWLVVSNHLSGLGARVGVGYLGVLALCGAPRGSSQTMPLYKAAALSS